MLFNTFQKRLESPGILQKKCEISLNGQVKEVKTLPILRLDLMSLLVDCIVQASNHNRSEICMHVKFIAHKNAIYWK